jgi:hypothetical protein
VRFAEQVSLRCGQHRKRLAARPGTQLNSALGARDSLCGSCSATSHARTIVGSRLVAPRLASLHDRVIASRGCACRRTFELVPSNSEGNAVVNPIGQLLDTLDSSAKDPRFNAFNELMKITKEPVAWVYDAWDRLLHLAQHGDNHQRAIGVQLLASLAESDREGRILKDINELMKVTKDPMFVTAKHSLLCLWKVGAIDIEHQKVVIAKLRKRFKECTGEKNCTLIRYDIQTVMKKIYDSHKDESVRSQALRLIELETDLKYKKKYGMVWK